MYSNRADERRHDVFITMTHMQYANALEAVEAFDVDIGRAVLVAPRGMIARGAERLDEWGQCCGFSHRDVSPVTRLLGKNRVGRLARVVDNSRQLQRLLPADMTEPRVFVGNIQERMVRHFINARRVSEVVLLDDGIATLAVAQALRSPARTGIGNSISRLLGINPDYPSTGTFFTAYDVDPPAGWKIKDNTYERLRTKLASVELRPEAIFAGSPFVNMGWLTLDRYMSVVRSARDRARHPLVYVPHDREDDAVVQQIAEGLGCEVWKPWGALEVNFISEGRIPSEVYSTLSSVLPNMHKMFHGRVKVFAVNIEFEGAPPANQVALKKVYEYFERIADESSFEVIKL